MGEPGSNNPAERASPPTVATASAALSRPAHALDHPKLVTYSLEDYLAIADLDLFKPIIPEQRPQPKPATAPIPAASRQWPLLPAPVLVTRPLGEQQQSLQEPPPAFSSPPSPAPPVFQESSAAGTPPSDLAVTGYVQTASGWTILLENVKAQEARRVSPGEEAFGYRIQSLDAAANQLVLEKGGREVRLKLGNNKKEVRPPKKPSGDNQESNRNPLGEGESPGR